MNILRSRDDEPILHVPLDLVWYYLTDAQKDRLWAEAKLRTMPPWSARPWDEFSRAEKFQFAQELLNRWERR